MLSPLVAGRLAAGTKETLEDWKKERATR